MIDHSEIIDLATRLLRTPCPSDNRSTYPWLLAAAVLKMTRQLAEATRQQDALAKAFTRLVGEVVQFKRDDLGELPADHPHVLDPIIERARAVLPPCAEPSEPAGIANPPDSWWCRCGCNNRSNQVDCYSCGTPRSECEVVPIEDVGRAIAALTACEHPLPGQGHNATAAAEPASDGGEEKT